VAGCNDCHTPPGLVPKYLTKARNGFWHSFYFTTGTYHDPLRITARNRDVTERACRVCHAPLTDSIEPAHDAMVSGRRERTSCLRCHETVGHLE
jgi:cytochrome c nitrite reductase small subunit